MTTPSLKSSRHMTHDLLINKNNNDRNLKIFCEYS